MFLQAILSVEKREAARATSSAIFRLLAIRLFNIGAACSLWSSACILYFEWRSISASFRKSSRRSLGV